MYYFLYIKPINGANAWSDFSGLIMHEMNGESKINTSSHAVHYCLLYLVGVRSSLIWTITNVFTNFPCTWARWATSEMHKKDKPLWYLSKAWGHRYVTKKKCKPLIGQNRSYHWIGTCDTNKSAIIWFINRFWFDLKSWQLTSRWQIRNDRLAKFNDDKHPQFSITSGFAHVSSNYFQKCIILLKTKLRIHSTWSLINNYQNPSVQYTMCIVGRLYHGPQILNIVGPCLRIGTVPRFRSIGCPDVC